MKNLIENLKTKIFSWLKIVKASEYEKALQKISSLESELKLYREEATRQREEETQKEARKAKMREAIKSLPWTYPSSVALGLNKGPKILVDAERGIYKETA